jgi:hypothetical protein
MSQTVVARLEGARTLNRLYFKGPWVDQCPICNEDGVAGNRLLMCDFCPKAFHYGCADLEIRERAQKGDWLCPDCRKADNLTRLDAKRRKRGSPRLGTTQPQTFNTEVSLPITPPAVTEELRRKRGRPRKLLRDCQTRSND